MTAARPFALAQGEQQALAPLAFYEVEPDVDDGLPCGCAATEDCAECTPELWLGGMRINVEDSR